MRAPVVLLVLALVLAAIAAAWLAGRGGDTPPLPPPPLPADADPAPGGAATPQHGGRTASPPSQAPPPTVPAPPPPEVPPPDEPAVEPNVVLAVRGLVGREPVERFRWQFRNPRGVLRGDGAGGRAGLALEPHASGQVLVEAEGFAPWTDERVVAPAPGAPPLQLDVFLAPAVPAAGITLYVRDARSSPVAHVRVDAFALAQPVPPAWHLGNALWARRANSPDGRYVLPELAPGDWGIRVVATDEHGALLPVLPFRGTFLLTGDNGFVEDVPLAPGALLALELVDAAGAPFDPAVAGATTLRLTLPGGPPVARKWLVRDAAGATGAVDAVPGAGTVLLAEAVDAGQYALELAVRGTVRVQRQLFLRPGITNEERVVVP